MLNDALNDMRRCDGQKLADGYRLLNTADSAGYLRLPWEGGIRWQSLYERLFGRGFLDRIFARNADRITQLTGDKT